ncbi:MAG: Rdx family protein [Desulfuromonadales bacterium]|nr:Rdx family protein [Desulfuromonadales bacterium]
MLAEVELVESSGGVFEVAVDETLVYSQKQTGEFPDEAPLVEKIRGWLGPCLPISWMRKGGRAKRGVFSCVLTSS